MGFFDLKFSTAAGERSGFSPLKKKPATAPSQQKECNDKEGAAAFSGARRLSRSISRVARVNHGFVFARVRLVRSGSCAHRLRRRQTGAADYH
jgi:hypothetical protein